MIGPGGGRQGRIQGVDPNSPIVINRSGLLDTGLVWARGVATPYVSAVNSVVQMQAFICPTGFTDMPALFTTDADSDRPKIWANNQGKVNPRLTSGDSCNWFQAVHAVQGNSQAFVIGSSDSQAAGILRGNLKPTPELTYYEVHFDFSEQDDGGMITVTSDMKSISAYSLFYGSDHLRTTKRTFAAKPGLVIAGWMPSNGITGADNYMHAFDTTNGHNEILDMKCRNVWEVFSGRTQDMNGGTYNDGIRVWLPSDSTQVVPPASSTTTMLSWVTAGQASVIISATGVSESASMRVTTCTSWSAEPDIYGLFLQPRAQSISPDRAAMNRELAFSEYLQGPREIS
jgi:hypothetical protein